MSILKIYSQKNRFGESPLQRLLVTTDSIASTVAVANGATGMRAT
jgi:hypothetical protein